MSKKILVVDDDPDLVKVFALRLKQKGYETETAQTASESIQKVQSFVPNIILLDIQLPDGSGLDVAKKIRDMPDFKETPIIFITGKIELEKLQLSSFVNTEVLIKPCEFEQLLAKIEKFGS